MAVFHETGSTFDERRALFVDLEFTVIFPFSFHPANPRNVISFLHTHTLFLSLHIYLIIFLFLNRFKYHFVNWTTRRMMIRFEYRYHMYRLLLSNFNQFHVSLMYNNNGCEYLRLIFTAFAKSWISSKMAFSTEKIKQNRTKPTKKEKKNKRNEN